MAKIELLDEPAAAPVADVNVVVDGRGRRIRVRELDELTESRLVRDIGHEAASNLMYITGYVMPAAVVAEIDGEPFAIPRNQLQIDAAIKALGREGMAAVRAHLYQGGEKKDEADLKN